MFIIYLFYTAVFYKARARLCRMFLTIKSTRQVSRLNMVSNMQKPNFNSYYVYLRPTVEVRGNLLYNFFVPLNKHRFTHRERPLRNFVILLLLNLVWQNKYAYLCLMKCRKDLSIFSLVKEVV